jgi:anti-sigma B factor antagonist
MDAIVRTARGAIAIEKVNLVRATMKEAYQIKNNLLDDIHDYKKIIVDLSSCDYIDSTFLGALVYTYRFIISKNGILVFVIGDSQLSRSFIYREITKMFNVFRTQAEAINHLNCLKEKRREGRQEQLQLSVDDTFDNRNYRIE